MFFNLFVLNLMESYGNNSNFMMRMYSSCFLLLFLKFFNEKNLKYLNFF